MQRVVVVGLGLFGRTVALTLAAAGCDVLAVDRDKDTVQGLADAAVSVVVRLDATDRRNLEAHGVRQMDIGVVTISENFEANVMVAYHLLQLGVRKVIARVATPIQRDIMRAVGVHEVILPEEYAAERLAHRLSNRFLMDHVPLSEETSLDSIVAPKHFVGRTVADIGLRSKYAVNLISVRKERAGAPAMSAAASVVEVPGADYVIEAGDILVVVGKNENLATLTRQ
ncbi:MAG: TrkA family potassium uptake protein [Candidatus Schekmanbacteria bacterium]|nr:TrkA family potassium uptake protein [Candidatus Schekmanbacteria bacterium]